MGKVLVGIVVGIVALGVVTQLVVPGFVERDIEGNLKEEGAGPGGQAVVDVKSFPAVRLLWGSGDKLEVRGTGLTMGLDRRTDDPLGRLDGFDEVDIDLEALTAGPVHVEAFSLVKTEDSDEYMLRMDAETTPLALAEAVGGEVGGELGRLIAGAASSTLPDGGESDLPIDMSGPVTRTGDGDVDTSQVEASVAGVPAGPFSAAMVQAVLYRL